MENLCEMPFVIANTGVVHSSAHHMIRFAVLR